MNWLFLRGLARESGHWAGFPAAFESIVPNARVHFLDLPGVGSESRRSSPVSISGIVDDLRGRWLSLRDEHEGDWAVCAISLGGMVAMDWTERFPDDWSHVVLMNTSARNLGRVWHRLTPNGMKMLSRSLLTGDLSARENTVLDVTTNMVEDRDSLVESWVQIAEERPVRKRVALRQVLAATLYSAPASLKPPTLVLGGESDALVDIRCSKELSRRLGVPFRGHPDAGHDLGTDAPGWASEQVRDWLSALKPEV